MGKQRNIRLDIVKAIGIICVVLGHTEVMPAAAVVNLFHVGLFFVVSGIFFKEEYTDTAKGLGRVILKRITRLYIPFVLYNWAFLCFRNLFTAAGILEGKILGTNEFISQALQIMTLTAGETLPGPDWFIRALFMLEVMFAVVDFLTKKAFRGKAKIGRWVIACALLGIGYYMNVAQIKLATNYFLIPLDLGTICSCWILFTAGMDVSKLLKKKFTSGDLKLGIDIAMAAGGLALLYVMYAVIGGGFSYASNYYNNIPCMLLANILGFMFAYGLAGLISRCVSPVKRLFVFTGSVTLEILMMHLLGFKIVTVLYVHFKNLPRANFSAFPQYTTDIWFFYLIVGMAFSLVFAFVWGKIKTFLKTKLAKKRFIVYVLLAIVLLIVPQKLAVKTEAYMLAHPDYRLVFDEDYYLENNSDLQDAFGENATYEQLFEHFTTCGMNEGRQGCEEFDPHYYKMENSDLADAFGDDWSSYYMHYMQYGRREGREGAAPVEEKVTYEATLTAEYDSQNRLLLTVNLQDDSSNEYTVLWLPAYETDIANGEELDTGVFKDGVTCTYDISDVNYKYVLARKDGDAYVQASNIAYINNAGKYSTAADYTFEAESKKGLQIGENMISDVLNLETKNAFTNLIVSQIMTGSSANGAITYEYKGKEYYFNKSKLDELDSYFSELTKNNVTVTVGVINMYNEDLEELYYPEAIENHTATFYALNTSTREGIEYVEAFITFMSKRYDGSNSDCGLISNWNVGNEINESGTYNYMGERELDDYLTEYTRTFRVLYNIIKTNIPGANVYVPLEPWWGIDSNYLTYGGREFLTEFAAKMKEEGDIDWGLAYHAYSYPLSDPLVLNDDERTIDETGELTIDGYFTTDSENTVTITMENIDVLIDFMSKDEMLSKNGEVRSIILSEQGYTSNSNVYGKCEALQAASLAYAYYKTEMIDEIDSFIYFLEIDDENASLGNNYYTFGLESNNEDGSVHEKLSYRVYRLMDSRDSLEELSYIKDILGIKDWGDVIENFDETVFEKFDYVDPLTEEYIDISDAIISDIEYTTVGDTVTTATATVTLNGEVLMEDIDYDLVCNEDEKTGAFKVMAVGIGNYNGITSKT